LVAKICASPRRRGGRNKAAPTRLVWRERGHVEATEESAQEFVDQAPGGTITIDLGLPTIFWPFVRNQGPEVDCCGNGTWGMTSGHAHHHSWRRDPRRNRIVQPVTSTMSDSISRVGVLGRGQPVSRTDRRSRRLNQVVDRTSGKIRRAQKRARPAKELLAGASGFRPRLGTAPTKTFLSGTVPGGGDLWPHQVGAEMHHGTRYTNPAEDSSRPATGATNFTAAIGSADRIRRPPAELRWRRRTIARVRNGSDPAPRPEDAGGPSV